MIGPPSKPLHSHRIDDLIRDIEAAEARALADHEAGRCGDPAISRGWSCSYCGDAT